MIDFWRNIIRSSQGAQQNVADMIRFLKNDVADTEIVKSSVERPESSFRSRSSIVEDSFQSWATISIEQSSDASLVRNSAEQIFALQRDLIHGQCSSLFSFNWQRSAMWVIISLMFRQNVTELDVHETSNDHHWFKDHPSFLFRDSSFCFYRRCDELTVEQSSAQQVK